MDLSSTQSIAETFGAPLWALALAIIWTLVWKGLALWKAARKSHLIWFIVLLIVNTMGILEILYFFGFSKIKLENKIKKKIKKSKRR